MRVRSYEIAAGGFPGRITIALVTDVHQRQPEEALAALKAMRPDMICMAGDILERNDNGMDPREGMEEAAPYRTVNARLPSQPVDELAELLVVKTQHLVE